MDLIFLLLYWKKSSKSSIYFQEPLFWDIAYKKYLTTSIKNVEDFKYLGSWIDNTQKDIKVRSTGLGSLQQALQNMEI